MEITALLRRVNAGDRDALNTLVPFVYEELRKLAAAHLRRQGGEKQGLNATALVHEAFIRLAGGRQPSYENRSHFYGIASRLMRQILVDAARARAAAKRNPAAEMPWTELAVMGRQPDVALLAMDEALNRLAALDERKSRLIEMRFFGDMTLLESAAALDLPVKDARRELRLAQAWLLKEMGGGVEL